MKKIFVLSLLCVSLAQLHALEYEKQFENEQFCAARIKVAPHEEIGWHRDAHPQLVVALKGGIITRFEADGRITQVNFPTGKTVFRAADPENELHRSANQSNEPIEIISIQLKKHNLPPVECEAS